MFPQITDEACDDEVVSVKEYMWDDKIVDDGFVDSTHSHAGGFLPDFFPEMVDQPSPILAGKLFNCSYDTV